MSRATIRYRDMAKVFAKTGASSFGGWSTTALLLEKELITHQELLTAAHLKGAVAYAQILPGATQVSIVANTGYQLRGLPGACLAAVSYLLPAISLIVLFAALYFHFAHDSTHLMNHLDGLIAALSGVILANAYKIGGKHASSAWLWGLAVAAFLAKLWLGLNAILIIIAFGLGALLLSWLRPQKARA